MFFALFPTLAYLALGLLSPDAHAGKLAEGFRGKAFAPIAAENFPKPADTCRAGDRKDVIWSCDYAIGDVPVTVHYAYNSGIFWGYTVFADAPTTADSYNVCSTLLTVYDAAYGAGKPLNKYQTARLDQKYWTDGAVYATFNYNEIAGWCELLVFDTSLFDLVKRIAKDEAGKAVGDL